jgi:hypothetical protein
MPTGSESSTVIGQNSKITIGVAIAIVSALGGTLWKQADTAASIDKRLSVFEANSEHANESLESIRDTLREILSKQDGERERLGGHEVRISILEKRVESIEKTGAK